MTTIAASSAYSYASRIGLFLLNAVVPTAKADETPKNQVITGKPTIAQEMDGHDSKNWQKANWSNGEPFNNTWQEDNISFNNGIMTVTLDNKGCPGSCDSRPYASGEYRSKKEVQRYGIYETRMQAAKGDGLVTSFFNFAGTWGEPNHYEIDFEVLGKDCSVVQTNYYIKGAGHHEEMIPIPSSQDACEAFHTYAFKWDEKSITWYIDGKQVRNESVPTNISSGSNEGNTKIMANLWPGYGVDGWLGAFTYPGKPITAQYDWIRFVSTENTTTPAPKPVPVEPKVNEAAPANSIKLASLTSAAYPWNGGSVKLSNGVYTFSGNQARDPGFTIPLGNLDLTGKSVFKFELKGDLSVDGGYGRFAAQVYSTDDNDSSPSVIKEDMSDIPDSYQTITVPLEGITSTKKAQFMVITDSATFKIEIKDPRFE